MRKLQPIEQIPCEHLIEGVLFVTYFLIFGAHLLFISIISPLQISTNSHSSSETSFLHQFLRENHSNSLLFGSFYYLNQIQKWELVCLRFSSMSSKYSERNLFQQDVIPTFPKATLQFTWARFNGSDLWCWIILDPSFISKFAQQS